MPPHPDSAHHALSAHSAHPTPLTHHLTQGKHCICSDATDPAVDTTHALLSLTHTQCASGKAWCVSNNFLKADN